MEGNWFAIVLVIVGIVILLFVTIALIGVFSVGDLSKSTRSVLLFLSFMLISGTTMVFFGAQDIVKRRRERDLQRKAEATDERPIYKLYSPKQKTVITYIATPMAGSILLAISFGRLGKTASAKRALI